MNTNASTRIFLRLIPGISSLGPKCSMFEIRDATGAQLVIGERWGDDYLVIDGQEQAAVIKEILNDANFPYEEVKSLPHHLVWAID